MRSKILLIGFVFLLLSSFGIAEYPTSTNPFDFTQCYNLNEGTGIAIDGCETANGTLTGNTVWNTTDTKYGDGAVTMRTADAYLSTGNPIADLNTGDNITTSFWFKQESGSVAKEFFELTNNGDASQLHIYTDASNILTIGFWTLSNGGGYRYWRSSGAITTDTADYHHFIFQVTMGTEATTMVKIDNVSVSGSWQGDAYASPYGGTVSMRWGTYPNVGSPESTMDDILLAYNKPLLTSQQVSDIYLDNFAGVIKISETYPETNTQFNTETINLNATINASNVGFFNCSLFLNGIENYTWIDQANTTTLLSVDRKFDGDTNNTYFFNCSSGSTTTTSTEKYFYIDPSAPTITPGFTNGQILINSNLEGQFNFSDSFLLFSYNASIDGTTISNKTNLGVTEYSYNLSYDISSLGVGQHNLSIRVADGHTAKQIPDYQISNGLFNNYLEYTFPDNHQIKIENAETSIFDKFTTEKKKDRYSFEFEPNKQSTSYTFLITSSKEINIIETDSKYKNYIISGNQWIDFVSPDDVESKVKIKLNTPYEAEVTVSQLKAKDKFKFNSIGELNIVEQNFTFTIVNATVTFANPVIETQEHTTTLLLDFTDTGLTDENFTASLVYNGTAGSLTETTDSTTYVQYSSTLNAPSVSESSYAFFNWTVNISGNIEQVEYNHTIYKINIGDCEDHIGDGNWTKALTFLSLDEEGNATEYVNETTLNIDFSVWVEDEANYRNFSFGFDGGFNYSVCLTPNSSSYLVNAVAEYFAPNMANRKYYLDNYYLNATPREIYLYNLNSSKASDITIRVYDKNTAENIDGAFVKILRYYPETGTYRTVEIEKTDANGYTLGKMVLADVFYKFIVETDRTVRLDTSVERIISLIKNLGIIEGSDLLESWRQINDVNTFVGCNNATKKCTFTWSDSQNLVQTATLKVYRFNGFGRTIINEQSASSVAGTLTYTITEDTTGNTYTASGYIETNTANSFYLVGESYLEYLMDMHDKFGVSGVFPIMLLIIAVGAAFLETGAVGVIAGSLIGLVIMALTGFVSFGLGTIVTFIIIGGILIAKLRA